MSDEPPRGSPLDSLIAEAKADREPKLVRDLDWNAIESRVMADIDAPAPGLLDRAARRRNIVRGVSLALAIAATAIIWVRRQPATPAAPPTGLVTASVTPAVEASSFTGGELHVGGALAQPGFTVHEGDSLSVTKGRATFERAGAVSWLIEPDPLPARVRVTSAASMQGTTHRPLVVRLEDGAIEAQVVPIKEGEAFAVDVATTNNVVRVAVHGTHLRVARSGDRVVVDLTEGVIAIGVAPKEGMTRGTTVTAPAHVELDASDLATLRVDPSPSSVRTAIPLGEHAVAAASPPASVAVAPAAVPTTKTAKIDPPKPPHRSARETIVAAVRQCAVSHAKSGEVRVSVRSDLTLTVKPSGDVELAKFNPPLPPAVQSCAAETIYKTKLDETGVVSVPIEFSY